VLVLGATGRNFAAGMSGGMAFVLDDNRHFGERCNVASVALESPNAEDLMLVRDLLERHASLTGSEVAKRVLRGWRRSRDRFVKVMPEEYRRALRSQLELVG
jgi:glutamate synthase domain-containing protein 3